MTTDAYDRAQRAAELLGGPDGHKPEALSRVMALLGTARAPTAALKPTPRHPLGHYMAARTVIRPATAEDRRQTRLPMVMVRMHGDVKPFTSARVIKHAITGAAPFQPVTIDVASNGGNVGEALQIAREILAHPGRTKVIVRNFAHSAAALIVAAADERVGYSRARFLLHQTAIESSDARRFTAAVLREAVTDLLLRDDENVAAFLAARIGATSAQIHAAMNAQRELTADEALRLGLLTQIIR